MGITDRAANLEETQKGIPWRPEAGEAIGGTVVVFKGVDTKYGHQILLQLREEKSGELVDVWCRTVLVRSLKSLGVRAGDEVGIKYFGKAEGKNYHVYQVIAERDGKPLEPREESDDSGAKEQAAEKVADIAREEFKDDIPF